MTRSKATSILPLLALAACAAMPISGARLDELTVGRSFDVAVAGEPAYGIISFLPDQRVLWERDATGLCYAGTWTEPQPGRICFAYNNPTRQVCWRYTEEAAGRLSLQGEGDDRPYSYTELPYQPCSPNA